MQDISNAILAIPTGLRLCLTNPKVRKLAIKPWIAGLFSYFFSLFLAYYMHPIILSYLLSPPNSWWMNIVYYACWIIVAILLFIASSLLSIILVLITTAIFQTEIALAVLSDKYQGLAQGSVISEAKRTIWVESTKLFWLIPLFITIFLLGLIPPLTPFAIAANCWLIAYQFVDVVLDLFKKGTLERLKFARKNWLFLMTIGGCLMLLWAIPFVGILIPPAAIAGTAWALDRAGLLHFQENAKLK